MLQVSQGLSYAWDEQRPVGQRLVPGSLKVNGAPVEDAKNLSRGGEQLPGRRRRQLPGMLPRA
jgi:hypothetical protein